MGTRVIALIAQQESLDPVADRVQHLVKDAFQRGGENGRKVKNFLHGTWIGHPLHVILTDIPIGAWTTATIFDALETISGREEFAMATNAAITVGIAGALGAAVTGVTDWQSIGGPARRVGFVHALLNVTGLSAFTASLVQRKRGKRGKAKVWNSIGFLTMIAAARFGGNLVYDQRIGVDRSAGQTWPEEFVPVATASEIAEGQLRVVEHEGYSPILLGRRRGGIFAISAKCSHLGGPLGEGEMVGDTVQCPWHGSRFSVFDGNVVDGPAVHAVGCLEVRERGGQVEVRRARGRSAELSPAALPRTESGRRTGSLG